MARLFTISFAYNNEHHNSLVTVKTTPYYKEYTLSNLDKELLRQLPGNKIISTSSKSFLFPNATASHSSELMNTITSAVSRHLQTVSF